MDLSYGSRVYPAIAPRQRTALYAALPVVVCMLLPLTQVAGLFYLYDMALAVAIFILGFPSKGIQGAGRYRSIWKLFVLVVLVAWLSAVLRTGLILRPTMYTVQLLLGLMYARAIYENIIAGRLDLQRFASVIVWTGVTLAGIGILQFLLFQFNPSLAADLYRGYLDFSGFDTGFFDRRYMTAVWNQGMVRVVGTWDVTTTYAGMLALSAAWMLISKPPKHTMMVQFGIIMLAILMSGSRHAWLIAGLLFFGLAGGSVLRRVSIMIAFVSVFVAVVLVVDAQRPADSELMSLVEQVNARSERTAEQGVEDTSIQFRYVEGTSRFLSYALQDPMMLIFGVGTGTDKGLYEALGPGRFNALMNETHNMGFVSNSWLLIWRNWGILAFAALVGLFVHIKRLGGSAAHYGLLAVGVIFLADNYAAHVARCFFLLFLFLTALAAQGLEERNRRVRYG